MTTTRVMTVIALLLLFATHASAEEVFYLHTDALGSVVVVTDENANVVERREYEPYGLPITPIADGPGFTGHDMDGESGLVYMQQRYYDPLIGQFLSVDPMAVDTAAAWNFNRYHYAANNPYRYTDPDGREFRSPARFREAVLSDINSQTTEAYAFNEGGSLVSTGARTDGGPDRRSTLTRLMPEFLQIRKLS